MHGDSTKIRRSRHHPYGAVGSLIDDKLRHTPYEKRLVQPASPDNHGAEFSLPGFFHDALADAHGTSDLPYDDLVPFDLSLLKLVLSMNVKVIDAFFVPP